MCLQAVVGAREGWFSPSIMCVPGIKLRSSDLATSYHPTEHLTRPSLFFITCSLNFILFAYAFLTKQKYYAY